jgi:hypothetical protein
MKHLQRLVFRLLPALFMAWSVAPMPASDLRQSVNFNRDWKFQLGDAGGAEAVIFDDAKWSDIGLPHSFSMPYFAANTFYTGYGWYRKHFDVPSAWTGRRASLEFDGVFQVAEVFVNGQRVGGHQGGYTGFSLDITGAVKTGANVVAVRVNNFWNARLAPRAGEHVFSGGIYRDARLVVTAPLHVAWFGTFVTTPQVSKTSATVNVKTEVVNDSGEARAATVKTRVVDAKGKTVAQMESMQTIGAGATSVFDQTGAPVANPKLWSPEHPNLYSVKTVVLDGGKPVDDYTSPLGFRWFQFTADRGFYLNGEHYYFKGANVHQDHAGWGDAVADSGFFRDVKLVKDAGFDFIRGSHYPHAPVFAAACDQLGILFWSENCFWGTAGSRSPWGASAYPTNLDDEAGFEASVKASLRDMIRINRNHPSIIVWSMDNEVFFSSGNVMSKVRKLLRDVVAYTHELDSTRPAGIGGCQAGNIDKLGDVAGYNGDGARNFVNPGIPSVVTEYGSTMTDRPGKYEPGWGDLPGTPGADRKVEGSWRLPWRSGEVLWCAFDHGSIAGRRFGGMGMVDYFRLPKRQWYWYRNDYLHIPPSAWPSNGVPAALKLTADKTTLNSVDGTDDAQIIVTVVDKDGTPINNCPPVTLAVESGPGEFPTGPSITFAPDSDITIRDGQAAMEFRSYYAGKTVIRATSPGLKSATVKIVSLGEPKFMAGKTPPVQPRPYVRFTGGTAAGGSLLTLGLNNPTRASSEAPGHSGRLANDGNPATFWQAADGDTNAWWRVDLERIVTISQTKATFPTEGGWRYTIEISDDGENGWKIISDQTQNAGSAKIQTLPAVSGAHGRFLRVAFAGTPGAQPAALAELEVLGSLFAP